MSARTAARVTAGLLVALALVGTALLVLARTASGYEPDQSLGDTLTDVPIFLTYAIVGVIVTLKRPVNLVGWALVLAGIGMMASGVVSAYGELAVLARPELGLPAGAALAAVSPGSWTPLMAGVFLLFATFPSGTITSSRRRRWVVSVLSGFLVVWVLITVSSKHLDAPLEAHRNPAVLPHSGVFAGLAIPIIVFCLLSIVAAGVDIVRRFRRSYGAERQQFKWLALSAGLLVTTMPFAAALNWSRVAGSAFGVALIALPVSVGIAVLRYRLFEIDRIISRALAYAMLTVTLGLAYVGLVLAGQALFSSFAGGSNLAIAVSTLIVAALFLPLRSRIQRIVDRRFNRRRYDAQRTLETFGARLREQVELEALTADLRTVVGETMQPVHTSLWLRSGVSR